MRTVVWGALAAMLMVTTSQAAPSVVAAWSRPAAQGTTGVGFLTLLNSGAKPDALVPSVPLPPGGRVIFAPGGYHLMFLGLTKGQKVGDTLPATLVFASGKRLKAEFVVGLAPP